MLIGWSTHQVSDNPLQPSSYLLDAAVEKSFADGRGLEIRTPVPELLMGHPAVVQSALKVSNTALRYRVATLSFAADDIDVAAFNAGDLQSRSAVSAAIDLFLEMAFAGIPSDRRPPVLVGTHTHTGRLEINVALPRFVMNLSGKVRSFNPHPPQAGSKLFWDAFCDHLNESFGWANPRSVQRASQIKGPDWAEKRVAAADRRGQKFSPTVEPRLFLLQSAKVLARQHQGSNPAAFWEAFGGALGLTKYKSNPDDHGRLWLESVDGEPLVLKGELINSPKRRRSEPEKGYIKKDIGDLWQRRADQNSQLFSHGVWDEPAPNWTLHNSDLGVELPAHHPDSVPCKECSGLSHFVSLNARLSTALRAVRKSIARNTALLMVSRGLTALHTNFFTAIKHRLEQIENEHSGTSTFKNDEPYDQPVRSIVQGPRQGGRKGHRHSHHGNDGRSERDQRIDGALYQSDGSSGASNQQRPGAERDASRPESSTRSSVRGHKMAPPANEPATFSRIAFLGSLRRVADLVYPHEEVSMSVAVDGSFRVSLPSGEILISHEGNVTGIQGISESEVTEFVSAFPEDVRRHLLIPDRNTTPELFR